MSKESGTGSFYGDVLFQMTENGPLGEPGVARFGYVLGATITDTSLTVDDIERGLTPTRNWSRRDKCWNWLTRLRAT
jgi:hypothetical protein